MKKLVKCLLGTACMLCLAFTLNAKQGSISAFGICSTSDGQPLSGVMVSSSSGVISPDLSDSDGVYFIMGLNQGDDIIFKKAGFKTSTVRISSNSSEQQHDVVMNR